MMDEIPFRLDGKIIIVTGASSGIGRQCAITCSKMGAVVILLGRDQKRLSETLNLCEDSEKHLVFAVDMTEYEKVEEILPEVVSRKGKIGGLINCAGISTTLPINAVTPEKMEFFIKTNVIGGVNLTRETVKSIHFSEAGGCILFISSVMGVSGEKGKSLYSMTKGAVISVVRSLAVELAVRKIRVNAVSPGVVETPMSKKAIYSRDEESLKKVRSLHPLGLGRPEDVANSCVFLLSEAARWITGTNMIVDGGYLAR